MAKFRSKARLVEILGEHLIKDNTVGLLELVKNAYDADARNVEISLEHLDKPAKTRVVVADDGDGMTLETVQGPWLEPASGGKELLKEQQVRTDRGRLPLGEKGVGRFAAHKLGRKLILVTRHKTSANEVVLEIDWTPFEAHDAYLDEIELQIHERPPQFLKGDAHGTWLIMDHARERWRVEDLRRLQASLQKLKSPTRGATDFNVRLVCPEYPEFENLEPVDLLKKAHFTLSGLIDEDGSIEFDYHANFAGSNTESKAQKRSLWSELKPNASRKPNCGPFFVNLHAWIRKHDLLRQSGVTKEQLNAFSGVSLFRDGIRVLPYGDEGDDWLLLDKRRIDDPTRRFANNQVIGFIEINQTANRALSDKANREGLQENDAFLDLQSLVQGAVKLLEQYSAGERNKSTGEKKGGTSKAEVTTTIEEVEQAARKTETEARAVAQAVESLENKGWLKPEAAKILSEKIERLAADVTNYREKAETANETIKEVFSDDEKERETFLHLVAVGLVAERFSHEFGRLVKQTAETLQQLRLITKNDRSALEAVADVERYIAELQNELIPLGNLVHRSSIVGKDHCDVTALVQTVLKNNETRLKSGKVLTVVQPNDNAPFISGIRESVLAQVLDNLVDNAIYWLGQKSARDDRILKIQLDCEERTILVTNSGPPIQPHIRSKLFQKFQTSKLHGHGLGLFICREQLQRNGGKINLVDRETEKECLGGASFLIELPGRGPNKN